MFPAIIHHFATISCVWLHPSCTQLISLVTQCTKQQHIFKGHYYHIERKRYKIMTFTHTTQFATTAKLLFHNFLKKWAFENLDSESSKCDMSLNSLWQLSKVAKGGKNLPKG